MKIIAGSIDAGRIAHLGVPVVQINIGNACRLDANMVAASPSCHRSASAAV